MTKSSVPFRTSAHQYNCPEELNKTNSEFCKFLRKNDLLLYENYVETLKENQKLPKDSLIKLALLLESFLINLFSLNIPSSDNKLIKTISWVKKHFVQKQAKQKIKEMLPKVQETKTIVTALNFHLPSHLSEETLAVSIKQWLQNPEKNKKALSDALLFCVWAMATKPGKTFTKNWTLFSLPQPLDFQHLVSTKNIDLTYREGFDLTDNGPSKTYALDQSSYCLYCHERNKDSCSTGKYKDNLLEKNPLGYELKGCPLKQKISEMNILAVNGHFLAALAVAMIDNPLIAATGHRICQDCAKACIFQKQTPVDIPAIETFLFDTVLKYPYGFEIYFLLTRWNPLNIKRPLPCKPTNKKVLVAGMGPAGFSLAYHLLMEGHTVVGIDGLKIEPLSVPLDKPIKNILDYFSPLSSRLPQGFGGVAEYGITSRWNKNYLLPIRLVLERWNEQFQLTGSCRFGSTITLGQAYEHGFHHVALCIGAGKPSLPKLDNVLANGAKLASDFLMALQLSGAQREDTLLPVTLDLPCIVVGGGLTAVDAATEAQAYYPLQIKKIQKHYRNLQKHLGEKEIFSFLKKKLSIFQREQLFRWLQHAKELEEEYHQAQQENRKPNILKLINTWGGVHLVYRKKLQESPAYILNHPELQKALEEGINFWEEMTICKIHIDKNHTITSALFKHKDAPSIQHPVKSILWATGNQVSSSKEKKKSLGLEEDIPINWPKNDKEFILYKNTINQSLSCFGDYHPFYKGSVVKAMACAKNGYSIISQNIKICTLPEKKSMPSFLAKVYKNKTIAPGCHEVIFHAPWATKNFEPGHLYRLQSYFQSVKRENNALPLTEGIALTGVKANKEKGLLHTILWTQGCSSKNLSLLQSNQPVSLMGPVGCATHFEKNEKILLIAGQLGVSLGKKMRASNCQVVYTASFRNPAYPLTQQDFLQAGDTILACSENDIPSFLKNKKKVHNIKGQTLDALHYYISLKKKPILLKEFDRIIIMGSTRLLTNFQKSFYIPYKNLFNPSAKWVMAVTSPMQCMMQGVCGQCLQKDIKGNYTFSCSSQDQDLSTLDIGFMNQRLNQNIVQEVLFKAL